METEVPAPATQPANGSGVPARAPWWRRDLKVVGLGVVGLVVLLGAVDGIEAAYYAHKTYPLTRLYGMNIGGLDQPQLAAKMRALQSSYRLEIKTPGGAQTYTAAELGVNYADATSVASLTRHSWHELPLARLWHPAPAWKPAIDQPTLARAVDIYAANHRSEAVNATLTYKNDNFEIIPDKSGIEVDATKSVPTVLHAATTAARSVNLSTHKLDPDISAGEADETLRAARSIVGLALSLKLDDKTFQPAKDVIAGWLTFTPAADKKSLTMVVDKAKIAAYMATVAKEADVAVVARVVSVKSGVSTETTAGKNGRRIDQEAAITELAQAIEKRQGTIVSLRASAVAFTTSTKNVAVPSAATVTYSYCVALKGIDQGQLAGFKSELARVYADAQGWSLGGKIRFAEVAFGCNFTAWLAAADLVPSFDPSGCSAVYSCRVGPNVIINYDRYTGATPSWTKSLSEYHDMVISHETGHWLGFGHLYCPGPGQVAPVMQQQSISLQGCAANPWPTEGEKVTAARARGLTYP